MSLAPFSKARKRFFALLILCAFLGSLSGAQATEEPRSGCGQQVIAALQKMLSPREIATLPKRAVLSMRDAQIKYWSNIFQDCGRGKPLWKCSGGVFFHLAFSERQPRDRFHKLVLVNPFSLPFNLPAEVFKTRYGFSATAQVPLSMPLFDFAYKRVIASLQKREQNVIDAGNLPGTRYAMDLNDQNLIDVDFVTGLLASDSSTRLVHILAAHEDELQAWLGKNGDPRAMKRLNEIDQLGILSSEDFNEFSRLVYQVYLTEAENTGPDFSKRLQDALDSALDHDPKLGHLSPETKILLRTAYYPALTVQDESDVKLLARTLGLIHDNSHNPDSLQNLKDLARDPNITVTDLVELGTEIQKNPELIQQKETRWHSISPSEMPAFVSRPDLPELAAWTDLKFDSLGTGQSLSPLSDELSIWALVWKDDRFADIRQGVTSGETTQYEGLTEAMDRIGALNELYASYRTGQKPKLVDLCSWLGKTPGTSANTLISEPIDALVSKMPDNTATESCEIDLAETLYHFNEMDIEQRQGKAAPAAPIDPSKVVNGVLANCAKPHELRSCKEQQ